MYSVGAMAANKIQITSLGNRNFPRIEVCVSADVYTIKSNIQNYYYCVVISSLHRVVIAVQQLKLVGPGQNRRDKREKGERDRDMLNDRYLKDVYKPERDLEGDRERQNV